MTNPSSLMMAAVALLLLVPAAVAQSSQSLPAGLMATDGNGATSYPQNNTSDHRWHWHYDSAEFVNQGPQIITEIWVRASAPTAAVGAFSFNNFTVTLIEASTDYIVGAHDPIFANNILNSAVVRAGPWVGGPVPASGGATATWIPMGLTSSFLYDPSTGNDFIVQIEKCGTTATWGASMDGSSGSPGQNGGNRYGSTSSCVATSSSFNNNEFVPCVRIDYIPTTSSLTVAEIQMSSGGSPITFNTGPQTFSLTATIDSIQTTQGIVVDDPLIDPLVGASLQLSGNFAGADLAGLTDIILTPATLDLIVVPGSDELRVINLLSALGAGPDVWSLGGPLGATPAVLRALRQVGLNTRTRTGSGSGLLDSMNNSLQSDIVDTVFSIDPSGPVLKSLAMNYNPTPAAPARVFATDGAGSLEIGAIGLGAGSVVVNFVDVNPTIPVGSGILFGLNFGPSQFAQLSLPFPTPPILDQSTALGTYTYQMATGSLPAGLTIDMVTIEVPTGGTGVGFVSGVSRLQF